MDVSHTTEPLGKAAMPRAGKPRRFAPGRAIKWVLPRGLLGRSFLIIVIPLIVLQVVSGIIFYDRHWDSVSAHRANAIAGEILMLTMLLDPATGIGDPARVAALARKANQMRLDILPAGTSPAVAFEPRGYTETTLARALDGRLPYAHAIDATSQPGRITVWLELGDTALRIAFDSKRLISSTTYIFILWMIGTSIVLFAVAMIFMRNQVSPIRRLAQAAESFGKGRDSPAFKPSGATEVRQAARAFLAMRARILRQIQQRTEMLAGVSHDLRTPLTRMKLQLAMLGEGSDLTALRQDVGEMERLIEDYLQFARGEGEEQTQDVAVHEVLREIVRTAARDGGPVTLEVVDEVVMSLRRNAFRRCVVNLVNNAAEHGKSVRVSLRRSVGAMEVRVDDDGPGIPRDEREQVFRPFYRMDRARNPNRAGTGLGLAIARDIARNHGGDLTLAESPQGGLRARIVLPL